MPNRLICLLFILAPYIGYCQVFGGHPDRTHWRFVSDKKATIIFPKGSDSNALRIAGIIAGINARTDSSIGITRRPVSIVLQPRTTISNGYVALAPFRSEFYLTPPANPFEMGNLPWTDQLALHEYRHVEQYSNFNKGGSRILSIVLGEQGQALANALTVPDWFFEGDAVYQETYLSQQGRGRTPFFFNGFRSLWGAGVDYSFMTLRNGSLRHFVPDHYELGYQLIAYGHDHFGESFWRKTAQDAAAMKGVWYPFQKAIKHYSSMPYGAFINAALAESKQKLGTQNSLPNQKPPFVLHEENPVFTTKGDLLYLRSSYKSVPAFYLKQGAAEKRIRTMDRSLDHYFAYAKDKIVYASYRPDTRWGWMDYSELQVLDLNSGQQKRISTRSRYFSPSFSKNADSIVTVHVPEKGAQSLHILDKDGRKFLEIPNDSNLSYFHPVFWKGKILVAAKNSQAKMSLLSVDLKNGAYHCIIPWSSGTIGFPGGMGDTLYFTLSIQGQDRTMAFDTGPGKLFEVMSGKDTMRTGVYQPSVFGNELVQTRFTAAGYKIQRTAFSNQKWVQVTEPANALPPDFDVRSLANGAGNMIPTADQSGFSVQEYRKSKSFFNFHSWQPYYEDPEFTFSVYGQNILNTFQSQLYGKYNRNEGFKQIGYTGLYGGFYPFIKAELNYTFDRRGLLEDKIIYWNQLQASIGLSVPLNFSKGRSITYFRAGSDLVYNRDFFREPEKSLLGNRNYVYLDHDIVFSHQLQQARQEFNPRFAQTLHLNLRHTLNRYSAIQLMELMNLYFPGFFSNHSIVVNLAAQQRDSTKGIRFNNDFPFARGYSAENFYRVTKWGINYQLPLVYPDIGAWNIVYLLRLRTNVFYDQALVNDLQLIPGKGEGKFRSFGNELHFDTKWWNQLPVSFGIRYSRLLDEDVFGGKGRNRWQFILPVNLVPGSINSKRTLAF